MTQKPTHRCENCWQDCPVQPVTPWEFDWRCDCGNAGTIAWARAKEPPVYQGIGQLELFA